MKRRLVLLLIALVLSLAFAGWQWLRPYDWNPDPQARFRIAHVSLKQDHSFYWLGIKLERNGVDSHDLTKPVRLVTSKGREVDPTDTTMEGNPEEGISGLGFRFWLENDDLDGPLELRLNDGTLKVRSGSGQPRIRDGIRYFTTSRW